MYMPFHSGTQHTLYELVPFPPTFEDFLIVDFLITGLIFIIYHLLLDSLLLFPTCLLEKRLPCWSFLKQRFIWNCITLYGLFLPYQVLPVWLDSLLAPAASAVSYVWPNSGDRFHIWPSQPGLSCHSERTIPFPAPASDRKHLYNSLYLQENVSLLFSSFGFAVCYMGKKETNADCLPFYKFSKEFAYIESLVLPSTADEFWKNYLIFF